MTDELIQGANLIEAFLWLAIAAGFLFSLIRPAHRWSKLLAATNFAAFGGSDLVEMHTGAWWDPWWLFVWKALCIAVMSAQFVLYVRRKRDERLATRDTIG